jgi:ribosomal protein S3|eukprot:COSAG02_NODE_136_length_34556_cov_145.411150_4_plen_103_part_00
MIDGRMPVSQTEHQGKALNSSATSDSDLSRTSQRPKILGFRIICSGRLQISSFSKPAEKAESIEITRGVLPLNSFKANIDFAQTYATNAYGTCGIKVWVNRG